MTRGKKWGLAMLVACPSCAAGIVLVIGAIFGISAALVKGSLLGLAITVLASFWVRNAWRRRGEETCRIPVTSEKSAIGPESESS